MERVQQIDVYWQEYVSKVKKELRPTLTETQIDDILQEEYETYLEVRKMIYTVEEHREDGVKKQTFEGFKGYHGGPATLIASVDSPEGLSLWVIDENNKALALEELRRYYRASWGMEVNVFLFQSCQ